MHDFSSAKLYVMQDFPDINLPLMFFATLIRPMQNEISQNVPSFWLGCNMVSKYCLNFKNLSCGKICAATMCCIPLSHNISYNILISFIFLIVTKRVTFFIAVFWEDECQFFE